MLQYNIVGFAPEHCRDHGHYPRAAAALAEAAAGSLLGVEVAESDDLFNPIDVVSPRESPRLGVALHGQISIFIWSGVPSEVLNWRGLSFAGPVHRFDLGFYPASEGLTLSWHDPDGQLVRHVDVSGARVRQDSGTARVLDEQADTDETIDFEVGHRLPKQDVAQLLASAGQDDIIVYDGRRYVRSDDPQMGYRARITHTSPDGQNWVAVDQSGPVNTLKDPLVAALQGDEIDVAVLADSMAQAWFNLSFVNEDGGQRFRAYPMR